MADFLLPSLMVLGGLVLLVGGCEILVRGAAGLALAASVSPLVVGLTVVAFGTSAPEFAISVQSSYAGQNDLAVGNIVGSNIANVLLILGLAAVIAPLIVASKLLWVDVPLMITASFGLLVVSLDGVIGRVDGSILFGSLLIYLVWTIRQSRKESKEIQEEFAEQWVAPPGSSAKAVLIQLGLVVAGLVLLVVGARFMVSGAVNIARLLGTSELLIGLTVVAIGTSLPEVATSVVASLRGERDIAVGNVVGSNLFNVLGVLGLAGIVSPGGIQVSADALYFDIPVMIAVAIACMPIFFTWHRINRWEGALFLAYYVAYVGYAVMEALGVPGTRAFVAMMVVFVIPLTALTLLLAVVGAIQEKKSRAQSPESVSDPER